MNWQDRTRNWTPPTLRETVAGMAELINQAAVEERNAHASVQRFNPGDERLTKAQGDVRRCAADQRHWRQQLEYYRGLLDRFPHLADKPTHDAQRADYRQPAMRKTGNTILRSVPPAPHWSEREPGADDLDPSVPF